MSDNILELLAVQKSFGGLKVIDDVSFEVKRGSRTALIGPNGAGKTTVFNLISGLYPVDSGEIILDGHDITHLPARRRVDFGLSRSFQNIRLMPHLSTLENVMLGQHARAGRLRDKLFPLGLIPGNRWARQAEEALADADIGTYPGSVVADLPYGIQKRIEIARALVSEPKLLLLDEPAAGLNRAETRKLRELLDRANAKGITLLVVEHDMHFVHDLCDDVVVLNFGQKVFEGSPAGAARDPAVLEAYLGTDDVEAGDAA